MNSTSRLIISQQDYVYVINHNQIIFCKSESCYTTVYLSDGASHIIVKSLSKIAKEDLFNNCFLRVNQSFLVNRDYVIRIDKKNRVIELKYSHLIKFTITIKQLLKLLEKSEQ